jgi:hypothetical protein
MFHFLYLNWQSPRLLPCCVQAAANPEGIDSEAAPITLVLVKSLYLWL